MNRSNFPESHLYSSANDPSQNNFGSNSNPGSSYIIQPPSNYVFDAHYSSSTFIPPSQGRSRGGQSSMLPTMSQGLSGSSTTLFVGDISILCNEETIYDLFCTYGAIESVQLKKSERDPQRAHLSYGFVKFVTPESATLALQELNGKFVQGRCLRVGWADDHPGAGGHGRGGKAIDQKKNNQTAQIHVMFVCKDLEMMVSEVNLGSIFGSFGNLVDIAIKKNVANHELRVRSGYGFVHYALTKEGIQSAVTAVEEMNHRTVDNISFECKVTHSLQAHMFSMRRSDYGPGINHPPIPPPTSSYTSYPSTHRSAPAAAYLPGQSGFREAPPSYAPRVPPSVPFAPQRGFTHQQGFPVHLQHSPSYVNPIMSTYNADNTRYRRAPEREDYLTSADLQRQYEGLEPSYRSSYPAPPATATLNMREDSYVPTYTTSNLNPTVYPQQSPTPPIAANEASSFSSFTKELNESLSLLDSEKEGDARRDEQATTTSAVVTEEGKDPNY